MKKDFDLLLKVVSEEYADTLEAPSYAEVKKFLLGLYKSALEEKKNEDK